MVTTALPMRTKMTNPWVVGAALAVLAIGVSLLPTYGLTHHLNWVLWELATGKISFLLAYSTIITTLPLWLRIPGVESAIWWIVTYVGENGVWAIPAAIASLVAEGGLVGLAIAVLGTAFLG